MKWLLLLLQVWVSCLWMGHSEVVTPFASCPQFFYEKTPPNYALLPHNPAWICQRYNTQYFYATLYDRNHRIPVYSAYIYQPGDDSKPEGWLIEPQLLGQSYPQDIQNEWTFLSDHHVKLEDLKKSQAVLEDYNTLIRYTHGQLSPCVHHSNYNSKLTTLTLTNVVPLDEGLNKGSWNSYIVETMHKESEGCKTAYVVVGAVPGNHTVSGGRVNVPSHIWSSACCETDTTMKAWGVIAENKKNEVTTLTLGELEDELTKLYGRGQVSLFHSNCPRD